MKYDFGGFDIHEHDGHVFLNRVYVGSADEVSEENSGELMYSLRSEYIINLEEDWRTLIEDAVFTNKKDAALALVFIFLGQQTGRN